MLMPRILDIEEDRGLFTTVLPPFDSVRWQDVIEPGRFVWIESPRISIANEFDAVLQTALFGRSNVEEVQFAVHHVDFDLSLPSARFLALVGEAFPGGIDLVYAEKAQPHNLRLASMPRTKWPALMQQNQIVFHLHRPAGGEPTLLTSSERSAILRVVERFQGAR